MRPLRPHQVQAIEMLKRSLSHGRKRPLIQAPTGFGKTLLAAAIVEGALRKGKRLIFTVPALSLVDQTVAAFWAEGIRDVGVLQGAHEMTNPSRPVQVASVQTLARRPIPPADIVVVDEAHRWFDFYGKWMADEAWAGVPFVGLSATPWTKGLGRWYDDLIVAATTEQLIEAGYLSRFEVFAPSHPDLTGVRTVAGDYHEGDLSAAMDKPALTADVVETWRRLGEDRPTLVFAVDRAHARHLQERFAEAGIPTGYVDAFTELDEREAIRKKFHSGEMRVVVNVGCLTTGVDWDVRCIVLARPTKSEMLFVQIIGRGLRTADGKANCRIIDHSDTHLRLGFVTDVHREKLDDGQPKAKTASERKQPLPKECPSCSYLKPAKVHACPACGFAPATQSSVDTADGDIARVDGKMMAASRAARQRWYSEVLWICRERGYKPGWAANQYREKFGVWPRGLDDVPSQPGPEVASWVKSRLIRYAKGRAKGEHRGGAAA